MASDTLFLYAKGTASNADDTAPENSSIFTYPPMGSTQNVIKYQQRTLALDIGDTFGVTWPGQASSDWVCIIARVIGTARLTTVGVNWSGSGSVTCVQGGYGTARYPGIITYTGTKATSFTFAGLADGTEVEYLAAVLALDSAL